MCIHVDDGSMPIHAHHKHKQKQSIPGAIYTDHINAYTCFFAIIFIPMLMRTAHSMRTFYTPDMNVLCFFNSDVALFSDFLLLFDNIH
jgi:hypothetical protein